jgi:hypothetical protein
MMDEQDSDAYLFHAAMALIVVVLALMIDKLGEGVAAAFRHAPRGIDVDLLPPILIEVTIFLTGVCVLGTLTHLHHVARLRYRRHYFFMDALAGAFLLYVALACVHESSFNDLHRAASAPSVDTGLIQKGLTVLALVFVVLLVRALLAHADIRPDQRRQILWVIPFHLSGITLAVVATKWTAMLFAFAVTGAAGAMLYLALFWALRLQIRMGPQ